MQVGAWEDQLHTHHHRAIGHAPAVGVEHRGDWQYDVGAAQAPKISQTGYQRMQDGGAVRIDHAFGPPCGARGVAHRYGVVFIMVGVTETVGVGGVQQGFVVVELSGHWRA